MSSHSGMVADLPALALHLATVNTSHLVDSGSIGCIRVEDIHDNTYDNVEELGAVVEFAEPFEVEKISRGLLKFGHVEIETDPVYDETY